MKPKDDAEKLMKKYISICERWDQDVVNSKTIEELKVGLYQLEWLIPKQCALTAVDEMLSNAMRWWELLSEDEYFIIQKTYLKEVRSEIEKM